MNKFWGWVEAWSYKWYKRVYSPYWPSLSQEIAFAITTFAMRRRKA